jgi:hypothetical protein
VQGAETILGPIQEVTSPTDIVSAMDPVQDQQEQKQEKDAEQSDDQGSAEAELGLINTSPVQLKNDLEKPVTSGGMDTMNVDPGSPD